MFRPNRIGTPYTLTGVALASAANIQPTQEEWKSVNYPFNVINAAPVLDFGRSVLNWTPAAGQAIAANRKFAICQQFTVTAPLEGNVRGIEVTGSILQAIPHGCLVIPFINRIPAALGSTLAGSISGVQPTYFDTLQETFPEDQDIGISANHYRNQIIYHDAIRANIAGTFVHGFMMVDTGAGFSYTHCEAQFAVRQLNDQQAVNYADTLR